MPHQEHSPLAYLYAFFMSIAGATSAAAIKFLAPRVSVEFITFWQYVICLIICLIILKRNHLGAKELLAIDPEDRWIMVVRALSGLLGFYAFYMAIKHIPLVDATLLRHSSPLFVPLLAFALFRLKTESKTFIFILLGFVGVYITLKPGGEGVNIYHLMGLSAGALLATSMVTTNRLKVYPAQVVLFYYFFISLLGLIPVAVIFWQSVALLDALLILFVGLTIYLALWLYNRAFTLSSAAVVAPMTYLSVVHAGILGWLIWGHIPSTTTIMGMCLVAGCGLATTLLGAPKKLPEALSS